MNVLTIMYACAYWGGAMFDDKFVYVNIVCFHFFVDFFLNLNLICTHLGLV